MPSSLGKPSPEDPCPPTPTILRQVPLFALLDDEETARASRQVELKKFAPRQRIYKIGDPGDRAYVMVSGSVRVTTVDEDHQEVIVDQPAQGEFFGFASMLEQTPHQTTATAQEETVCIEVDRHDIVILLERKPHAGMDMLTVLGRQFHASQQSRPRPRQLAIPTKLSKRKKPSASASPIPSPVSAAPGHSSSLFCVVLITYASINIVLRGTSMGSLSLHPAESFSCPCSPPFKRPSS